MADSHEVVVLQNPFRALARLAREAFDGVYVSAAFLQDALTLGRLLQNEQILEGLPNGAALLDADGVILWSNRRLNEWLERGSVAGENFYSVLGNPEILGPDFCPFHTALATGQGTCTTLQCGTNRYYQVHAAPLGQPGAPPRHLIVTVRNVTHEVQQQQKLAAIHQAGMELADLKPEELLQLTVPQRIELLKANILHYTRDLLNFDVVEIRLVDPRTNRLEPLLAEGIEPEAADRVLCALPQDNGVTGFVAATGKSYLCEDTTEDPLYLEGIRNAKSSLTVPLMLHENVIGTFNVESPKPRAFTESDLQFLEIFSREVARALNTLELLRTEHYGAAAESVETIHRAVALPVDEILSDAVHVMARYIDHDPELVDRLQRILRNARDIKQVIQAVGQQMTPAPAYPQEVEIEERAILRGKRILVVDPDETVRTSAHHMLEPYGCAVETARDGAQALCMVRMMFDGEYDAILAGINLPDMDGYEFLLKLKEILDPAPLALMTGFDYDAKHTLVKARQAGLKAIVYNEPFHLDQLLGTLETLVHSHPVREICEG
ncbi:MAG: GAF domain-containing protein [Pirellulales bacterium]|nr:GAF domain-containing protein [Pirellulales bacterium]